MPWLFSSHIRKCTPKSNRLSVAENELAVATKLDEAGFACHLLVQISKIKKGGWAEVVKARVE
jgi:hypothetical protein